MRANIEPSTLKPIKNAETSATIFLPPSIKSDFFKEQMYTKVTKSWRLKNGSSNLVALDCKSRNAKHLCQVIDEVPCSPLPTPAPAQPCLRKSPHIDYTDMEISRRFICC